MSRDASGAYTAPDGTDAVPGAVITSEQFNTFVADIGAEVGLSARESELRDLGALAVTGGTGAAYTLALDTPWEEIPNGLTVGFRAHTPNSGPCTLAANGSDPAPLRAASGVELSAGDLPTGSALLASFNANGATRVFTGTLTTNSNQVVGVASTDGLVLGQAVTGAGIPADTVITAIAGTLVSLSKPYTGATGSGVLTARGGEWLLANGGLLATAARLSAAQNGAAPLAINADTSLDASSRGRTIYVTGSPRVLLPPASVGPGYAIDIRNDGSGDVTLSSRAVDFSGSLVPGSNAIQNVSSTSALAVGNRLTVARSAKTITGTLTNGSAAITTVSDTAGLAAGQLVSCAVPGFPAGAAIQSISGSTVTITAPFTGTTTAATLSVIVDGIATGTFITAISGNTVTMSAPFAADTVVSAVVSAYADSIDSLPFFIMYPGETRRVVCDGTVFRSIVLNPYLREWTASGWWMRPPGYRRHGFHGVAGGGGGSYDPGGGGEGLRRELPPGDFPASMALVVGAAGAASPPSTKGGTGGATIVGNFASLAGGEGGNNQGGSGGGYGGGTVNGGGDVVRSGGDARTTSTGSATGRPISSIMGGGGGVYFGASAPPGRSTFAGDGGSRQPAQAPGVGGGGYGSSTAGVDGGPGGSGRIQFWGIA